MSDKNMKKNIKQNVSKDNLKTNNKGNDIKYILIDYFNFYKKNLMKKHIIVFILCLIIFFIMLSSFVSKVNSAPNIAELAENAKKISENTSSIYSVILSKKFPLVFLIILAGMVPYLFIPVIGIAMSYNLALDIATNFNVLTGKSSVIFMSIGAIIELIAISLSVSAGIYYCIISTKKWRYSKSKDYSMLDFKKTLYEATNNKKKLNEVKKKKEEKNKKNEKNNVKVPYLYLIITLLISAIIIFIGTIIAKV